MPPDGRRTCPRVLQGEDELAEVDPGDRRRPFDAPARQKPDHMPEIAEIVVDRMPARTGFQREIVPEPLEGKSPGLSVRQATGLRRRHKKNPMRRAAARRPEAAPNAE